MRRRLLDLETRYTVNRALLPAASYTPHCGTYRPDLCCDTTQSLKTD
jgi:hypothetical protein